MSTPAKTSARRSAAPAATKTAKSKATRAGKAGATKATRAGKAGATTAARTAKLTAAKATAAKTAGAANTARTRAAPPVSPDEAVGEGPRPWIGGERWPGRGFGRRRGVYNRQLQRANERWPIGARVFSWLFRRPELLLVLLGNPAPVRADGQVLNRSTQALLALTSRLEGARGVGDTAKVRDLAGRRKQMQRFAGFMPTRTDVYVVERSIQPAGRTAPSNHIPVRIYRQFGTGVGAGVGLGSRPPAIVYYHGGGWVRGDLISHDPSCRLLAAISGCVVVAVDYRLAPEDPFPAAVEDALAAYGWVHDHAEELGIAEGRVGVMGDSTGGNLAAAVALLTRKGVATPASIESVAPGIPAPVAQGLVYPTLSTRFDSESVRRFGTGYFLTEHEMTNSRRAYLPNREDWELGAVSPLLADDVAGVAPALVVTAGFDPLRDEGDAYAVKLQRAGIEVEHRRYVDQIHGFFGMGFLADSLALSIEVCDAMGRMMHRDAPARGQG